MEQKDILKSIKLIKERRKALKLSYQKLADITGMSKSTLQRYESGAIKNLPVDKLRLIAEALETTPAYLMGWEEIDYCPPVDLKSGSIKEEITKIILKSKSFLNHCGFNIEKLSEEELKELSEDFLHYIILLSYKYKKKE